MGEVSQKRIWTAQYLAYCNTCFDSEIFIKPIPYWLFWKRLSDKAYYYRQKEKKLLEQQKKVRKGLFYKLLKRLWLKK